MTQVPQLIMALPPGIPGHHASGACLLHVGKSKEALADAERSLELRPNDPFLLEIRGIILEGLRRKERAVADLRATLSQDPSLGSSQAALKRELLPCRHVFRRAGKPVHVRPFMPKRSTIRRPFRAPVTLRYPAWPDERRLG